LTHVHGTVENTSMFEQPPLTVRDVFTRGFLNGLASIWLSFILSVVWALWNELSDGSLTIRNLRSDVVPVWLVICTLGCLAFAFPKDEERLNLFRSGLVTAYVVFLLLDCACWLVKF
jgi:hypothetical protein